MSYINKQLSSQAFSMGEFVWFIGVVEDRADPEEIGRVRVRMYGYHTEDKELIPTEDLYWATIMQPAISSYFSGIGYSPTGLINGSTVIGFYLDGHNCQVPVVIGTIGGKPNKKPSSDEGFNDPNEVYPRYDLGESDVNRLARGKISKTVVEWRKKNLASANKAGGGKWKEPITPYKAKFPYNNVMETEPYPDKDVKDEKPPDNSGHIMEFDDTPGAERVYIQHKKGIFTEWHPDGTEVHKVMKNRYIVIEKDDHLYVKGDGIVTIEGNAFVLIEKDCTLEIKGKCKEHIVKDYELKVDGKMQITVAKQLDIKSGKSIKMTAPRIDLN